MAINVPVRPTPAEQCVTMVVLGTADVAARTTFLRCTMEEERGRKGGKKEVKAHTRTKMNKGTFSRRDQSLGMDAETTYRYSSISSVVCGAPWSGCPGWDEMQR